MNKKGLNVWKVKNNDKFALSCFRAFVPLNNNQVFNPL